MGEELGKALDGKREVVICETELYHRLSIARLEGGKDVLKENYPDIEIVQTTAHGGDTTKGLSDIENMITSYPDFDAPFRWMQQEKQE